VNDYPTGKHKGNKDKKDERFGEERTKFLVGETEKTRIRRECWFV